MRFFLIILTVVDQLNLLIVFLIVISTDSMTLLHDLLTLEIREFTLGSLYYVHCVYQLRVYAWPIITADVFGLTFQVIIHVDRFMVFKSYSFDVLLDFLVSVHVLKKRFYYLLKYFKKLMKLES